MSSRAQGWVIMSGHNLTGRLWALAAAASLLLPPGERLGWWLPLHLLLTGTVSQAIVGGHVMFSTTLGMAPTPPRGKVRAQLILVNLGAALLIAGRLIPFDAFLGIGGTAFLGGIVWSGLMSLGSWKKGLGSRFMVTRTYYTLAGASIVIGGTIGMAIGLGWMSDLQSYLSHRTAHMAFNLFGWVGLTMLGTIVTLLPTMLHVRAAAHPWLRHAPWIYFGGLLTVATGLSLSIDLLAGTGALVMLVGMSPNLLMMKEVLGRKRRRRIPTSAVQVIASMAWFGIAAVVQIPLLFSGDILALRDLYVVGMGLGVGVQAVIGSWAYLVPMERPAVPELRRRELASFEIGAWPQAIATNLGLVLLLGELRGLLPGVAGLAGLVLVIAGLGWGLFKVFFFRRLARGDAAARRSEAWWVPIS